MKISNSSLVVILSFLNILLLPGCAANLTPIEVSDRFWTAVINSDDQALKKHIISDSVTREDLTDSLLRVKNYTLGRTIIDQDQAWVDTTVEIGDDKPFSIPVKTVLVQVDNQWKVDYAATVTPISGGSEVARVLGSLNELGITFADKLDRSLGKLQKDLPEIQRELEKIEESMKQKLPELQERIDEFLRQLEEALGEGRLPQKTPQGTREI